MMLKRASPMPPMAFFVAKLVMCTIFAAAVLCVLAALGVTIGQVRLPTAPGSGSAPRSSSARFPSARSASDSDILSDRTPRRRS